MIANDILYTYTPNIIIYACSVKLYNVRVANANTEQIKNRLPKCPNHRSRVRKKPKRKAAAIVLTDIARAIHGHIEYIYYMYTYHNIMIIGIIWTVFAKNKYALGNRLTMKLLISTLCVIVE